METHESAWFGRHRSRIAVEILAIVVLAALGTGVWTAFTSMSHGVLWGVMQGIKAVFDLLTWLSIGALFVAGAVLVVRYA
jgi:hypothetical protein